MPGLPEAKRRADLRAGRMGSFFSRFGTPGRDKDRGLGQSSFAERKKDWKVLEFLQENIMLVALVIISGTMLLWPTLTKGKRQKEVDSTDATELINKSNAQVVDIRTEKDFKAGHIAGSVNLPATVIHHRLNELDKARPVLLVSSTGNANMPGSLLKGMGFTVTTLKDGIAGWRREGLPLVR